MTEGRRGDDGRFPENLKALPKGERCVIEISFFLG